MASVREALADSLVAALPRKSYVVIPDERSLDTLDRRTIIVSQQGFAPFIASPLSHLTVRFTVRVISPLTDLTLAEDDLTDAVSDVCFTVEALAGTTWTDAQKVIHNTRYLAYDISVEVTANKKKEA